MRLIATAFFVLTAHLGFSNSWADTLWINHDTVSIGTGLFHLCAFNDSSTFNVENAVLELEPGDTIALTVINNDSIQHTFTMDGHITSGNTVPPGGSIDLLVHPTQVGTYRYYSDVPAGELIGASGIVMVGYQNYDRFYWNLYDAEDTVNLDIVNNVSTTVPADYRPENFSINGHSFPDTMDDSTGLVVGDVGDTLIISMVNSGPMIHTMHFHGYHVELLQMSISTHMQNWIKDSFPVLPGETVTVRLVPDQPGIYPVHDHNLISVTNAGFYPGGMIQRLIIGP